MIYPEEQLNLIAIEIEYAVEDGAVQRRLQLVQIALEAKQNCGSECPY